MRKSKVFFTDEERVEFKKIILKEAEEALGSSEYKEFESLYAHLTTKERIEEVIYRAVKKAVEKADDAALGLAARYAKTANENRAEEKARRGRPKEHESGRQVSIWLEQPEIEKMKSAAEKEGKSVSELGAAWLSEKLNDI